MKIRNCSSSEYETQINVWGIHELGEKKWKELSLGQKKRVFLSFSLLNSIPVWVLDEPSSGLDAGWVQRLSEVINRSNQTNLILFSTHDPHLLEIVNPKILKLERLNGVTHVLEI